MNKDNINSSIIMWTGIAKEKYDVKESTVSRCTNVIERFTKKIKIT